MYIDGVIAPGHTAKSESGAETVIKNSNLKMFHITNGSINVSNSTLGNHAATVTNDTYTCAMAGWIAGNTLKLTNTTVQNSSITNLGNGKAYAGGVETAATTHIFGSTFENNFVKAQSGLSMRRRATGEGLCQKL